MIEVVRVEVLKRTGQVCCNGNCCWQTDAPHLQLHALCIVNTAGIQSGAQADGGNHVKGEHEHVSPVSPENAMHRDFVEDRASLDNGGEHEQGHAEVEETTLAEDVLP